MSVTVRQLESCRHAAVLARSESSSAMAPTVEATAQSSRLLERVADYVSLTKPRVASLVLVTVAVGAYVGFAGSPEWLVIFHAVIGTGIVAGGASAINQALERDSDRLMRRTRTRPVPAGRIEVFAAGWFGAGLCVAGTAYLAAFTNGRAAALAALTAILYAGVYTPLKRVTSLNTATGAIPGALPPVIGCVSATGQVTIEAGVLFAILYLWQFPHFLAIAWLYRDEYRNAGLKMLPGIDMDGSFTGRQMVTYSLALLPVSLLPSVLGVSGPAYFVGAMTMSVGFLACAIGFGLLASDARARLLLRASLVYLPILLVLLMADLRGDAWLARVWF